MLWSLCKAGLVLSFRTNFLITKSCLSPCNTEIGKIVNFSGLLFATLMIGRNFWYTQKNTLLKWSLDTFYSLNCLFVSLCILCLKMKTFLFEESVLRYNERNCFPSYPDHYLIIPAFEFCKCPSKTHCSACLWSNIVVHVSDVCHLC